MQRKSILRMRKLRALERMRYKLARKLDLMYSKDDTVTAIWLEAQYEKIVRRIEQIRSQMKSTQLATKE